MERGGEPPSSIENDQSNQHIDLQNHFSEKMSPENEEEESLDKMMLED